MKKENNGFIETTLINPHYHSKMKGCKIVRRDWQFMRKGHQIVSGGYCRTHKQEICRSGWEWHYPYGHYYKPLHPELYQRIKITRDKPEGDKKQNTTINEKESNFKS